MTLQTEFTSRYSDRRVRELTNPDKGPAEAVDTTRLAAAVDDAEGEFQTLVQDELDLTDKRHVTYAVRLVEVILMERGSSSSKVAASMRSKLETKLKDLRNVTGRSHGAPVSNSAMSPTAESRTGTTKKPWTDDPVFEDYGPDNQESGYVDD